MRVGLVVSCLNTLSEEIVSGLNSRETSDIVAVVQNVGKLQKTSEKAEDFTDRVIRQIV